MMIEMLITTGRTRGYILLNDKELRKKEDKMKAEGSMDLTDYNNGSINKEIDFLIDKYKSKNENVKKNVISALKLLKKTEELERGRDEERWKMLKEQEERMRERKSSNMSEKSNNGKKEINKEKQIETMRLHKELTEQTKEK